MVVVIGLESALGWLKNGDIGKASHANEAVGPSHMDIPGKPPA
jgi:hypothetical protein